MRFSERRGLKPIKTTIQINSMDEELQNGLWSLLQVHYWQLLDDSQYSSFSPHERESTLLSRLWVNYFKEPLDSMSRIWERTKKAMRNYFFSCEWYEVYDFIEFVANYYPDHLKNKKFQEDCNVILEREVSGYRFVNGRIAQITSEEEIKEIEEAVRAGKSPVVIHLSQALEHLTNRKVPDYRNSIKESISAVEAMCQQVTGNPKATLGEALNHLEKKGFRLHPALKNAFSKLYGWTSDASGIRHAIAVSDDTEVSFEDAKFMLVACSAFVNYLKAKSGE